MNGRDLDAVRIASVCIWHVSKNPITRYSSTVQHAHWHKTVVPLVTNCVDLLLVTVVSAREYV